MNSFIRLHPIEKGEIPSSILNIGGQSYTEPRNISMALRNHFQSFYKKNVASPWQWTRLNASRISEDHCQSMLADFSKAEIWNAIHVLNQDGAPRPDGHPIYFYTTFWSILKKDLLYVLNEFRMGNYGFEKTDKAHIMIFPKLTTTDSIEDFRPIFVSNSLYLIIPKF